MTDTEATLKELIERLEKATGRDRRMDFDIWVAVTKPGGFPAADAPEHGRVRWYETWKDDLSAFPAYTSSLDAAMTLVPEGWDWRVSGIDFRRQKRDSYFGYVREYREDMSGRPDAEGSARHLIPAIALCIAALKARAAVSTD